MRAGGIRTFEAVARKRANPALRRGTGAQGLNTWEVARRKGVNHRGAEVHRSIYGE